MRLPSAPRSSARPCGKNSACWRTGIPASDDAPCTAASTGTTQLPVGAYAAARQFEARRGIVALGNCSAPLGRAEAVRSYQCVE